MAKPDCDDGWLKYAHELDAALAVADFTKGARIVLREVFAQIFGPAKSKTASVAPTRIADRIGMRREQIARGVKELTDARVLIRTDDGAYRFNKDYETWLQADGRKPSTGNPRLSSWEVSYCRHAPAVSLAYKHGLGETERNHPVTERNQMDTENSTNRNHPVTVDEASVTIRLQERNHPVTQNVTNGLRADSSPPDPPYENGRAEFETLRIETNTHAPLPPEGGAACVPADPNPDPGDEPFLPPPDAATTRTAIVPSGRDSPEAIKLEEWAATLGADRNFEGYGFWAREKCDYVPAAWVRALLEEKVQGRSGIHRASIPLLGHILRDWMNAGECPKLRAAPHPGPALPPPTEYHVAPANSRHRRGRGNQ